MKVNVLAFFCSSDHLMRTVPSVLDSYLTTWFTDSNADESLFPYLLACYNPLYLLTYYAKHFLDIQNLDNLFFGVSDFSCFPSNAQRFSDLSRRCINSEIRDRLSDMDGVVHLTLSLSGPSSDQLFASIQW